MEGNGSPVSFLRTAEELPYSEKSRGLGKGSELQYDLCSEEVLKILENI